MRARAQSPTTALHSRRHESPPVRLSRLMHRFGEWMFSGRTVDAVRAGRCRATRQPERTTRRGRGGTADRAPSAYITRMRGWLEQGSYQAATARRGGEVLAYVLWRDDLDYGDIFIVLPHDPRLSASHNQSARWPPLLLNEDIEG